MGSNIELTASILWKLGQVKSEFAKENVNFHYTHLHSTASLSKAYCKMCVVSPAGVKPLMGLRRWSQQPATATTTTTAAAEADTASAAGGFYGG